MGITNKILKEAESTDCREETGITVGLVDSIISVSRILANRDLEPDEVAAALDDLAQDEDLEAILNTAKKTSGN